MAALNMLSPLHFFNLCAWSNMSQTSNHNFCGENLNLSLKYHSSCSITAVPSTTKDCKSIDTPRMEMPFDVYVGMSVFAKTRKRPVIDMLQENGLSISNDSVLEISAQLEVVIVQFMENRVVCTQVFRKHFLTIFAVDNTDHNPNTTIAKNILPWHQCTPRPVSGSQHSGEEHQPLSIDVDVVVRKVL